MNTLELFCGTKSFSNVAKELGHSTHTVDVDPQHNPDELCDIMEFKTDMKVDVLWASPPCQGFSVASIGKMWNKDHTPKHDTAVLGLLLLERTVELIEEIKPKYFFIENPRGKMRRMQILEGISRKTITYCQYGDTRMKPTDIWTNCDIWTPRPPCKNGDKCHISAPRGSKTGTQGIKGSVDRGRIPRELFIEIFLDIKHKLEVEDDQRRHKQSNIPNKG